MAAPSTSARCRSSCSPEVLTVAAGFSPIGDVSTQLGTMGWYLLSMVAISGAVPIAYYQIGRGN